MSIEEFEKTSGLFIQKITQQKYVKSSIIRYQVVFNCFLKYLKSKNIVAVDLHVIKKFLKEHYGFELYHPKNRNDRTHQRPLLVVLDLFKKGTFQLAYYEPKRKQLICYENLVNEYKTFVDTLTLSNSFKDKKVTVFYKLCSFLENKNIYDIKELTDKNLIDFVNSLSELKFTSRADKIYRVRDAVNWLHQMNYISYSGNDVFPRIVWRNNTNIPTYYTKDEIHKLLDSLDTSKEFGKKYYAILMIIIHLGLRKSDVANLKFSEINWENNSINIVQTKTKKSLSLPLIDEVKYPLLDYLKNARPKSNSEYIFIRPFAPYEKLSANNISGIVSDIFEKSGINIKDKHHSCHSLRFSLANNMLQNDISMSTIANVLGHSNIRSTNVYLSIDTKNLRKLALEVPNYDN